MYNSVTAGIVMHPEMSLNQYVFLQKLGEGGMGEVWKGKHAYLDYEVAIKFLKPQYADDVALQERFLNEGKRQANLDHPNIVRATDFLTNAGRHYLVMKFVEGRGLDSRIAEAAGPLPLEEAMSISYQVLSALHYAHEKGVIHRDVKPSNVLLDREGRCYLTDFGIALAINQLRVTHTGTVIGTPHYMSPEQIRNPHSVDRRADIYAFGVVLFEMLTGVPPFDAEGGNEFLIKQAHVAQAPPKPSRLNPLIPKPVEAVILRALAKHPDDRWPTCEAMSEALERASHVPLSPVRHTSPQGAPTPPGRPDREPRRPVTPLPDGNGGPGWLERNKLKLGAGVVLSVALGAGGLWWLQTGVRVPDHQDRGYRSGGPDQSGQRSNTGPPGRPQGQVQPGRTLGQEDRGGSEKGQGGKAGIGVSRDTGRIRSGKAISLPSAREGKTQVIPPASGYAGQSGPAKPGTNRGEDRVAPPEQRQHDTVLPPPRDGTPGAIIVPDPGPSLHPPRQDILRPDTQPSIPPNTIPTPAPTPPPIPIVPSKGMFMWSVDVKKDVVMTLTDGVPSAGTVTGRFFPGVRVSFSITPPGIVGVVEPPGPGNGWRKLALRGRTNSRIVIYIHWERL